MRFTIALPFFAGTCASVPIPKFAIPCSTLSCELRNQRDTSKIMILVPLLNPKFAIGFAAMCANFGFGALALLGAARLPRVRSAGPCGRRRRGGDLGVSADSRHAS